MILKLHQYFSLIFMMIIIRFVFHVTRKDGLCLDGKRVGGVGARTRKKKNIDRRV